MLGPSYLGRSIAGGFRPTREFQNHRGDTTIAAGPPAALAAGSAMSALRYMTSRVSSVIGTPLPGGCEGVGEGGQGG